MRSFVRQGLRFVAVGLINTGIGLLAIYSLMYLFAIGPLAANCVGYAVGFVVSFMLNRFWTFEHRGNIKTVLPRYLLVIVSAYLLNFAIVFIGVRHLGINAYLIQVFGIGVYTVTTFFGCRHYVFAVG